MRHSHKPHEFWLVDILARPTRQFLIYLVSGVLLLLRQHGPSTLVFLLQPGVKTQSSNLFAVGPSGVCITRD